MLILNRNISQKIIIGGDIEITVLGISGNQVKLGVNAPASVTVDREEVFLRRKIEEAKSSPSLKLTATANVVRDE